jgi:hypothetical protein
MHISGKSPWQTPKMVSKASFGEGFPKAQRGYLDRG